MLDSEVRPKMVGSKRISTALAIELGLPVDIIEQAIEKALKKELEQNEEQSGDNTLDNSFPSSPTNIQDSEPVNELSRSNHDLHPSPDNGLEIHKIQIESSTQSFKKNRKDSLSSLIEITQSGSTSINIKLPSLYASSQTVQGEISQSLAGSTKKPSDININSVDGNLNRTENILYSDEQNIHNKGLMQDQQNDPFSNISKEYIQPQNTIMPEVQNRQNNSVSNISKEYIQPQNTIMPEVQNRQNDSVPDVSKEYIQPQIQNTYEPFMPEAQSRQIDSAPDEFIQPQRRDSLDQVQDTYDTYESFMPETEVSNVSNQRQQVYKSFSNGSHSYTSQSQVYISQVIDQQPQPKLDLIKNKPSEMYLSEFPSLSEAAKKGDSRKNSEVDLGAWGQMDVNIASAWGKPKKWLPETTETVIPEPPVTTWNPDDVNQLTWKPIQEPKAPIFFKKKKTAPVNFELDDNEGWGAPPTKFIPWDDSRQGYCVDLIEEQQGTVFWSVQNGTWVNVSEEVKITQEMKITQEKRIVECTSDGVNHRNIRQTRTHTQRTRQGIDNLDGATWDDIREQTRRERVEKGLAKNEILMIDLTDDDNSNSNSSKIEDFQSNSAKCTTTSEGPRERLGNPQWKTEEEWRVPKSFQSLDMQDASDSKNSDEETSNDRDENVNFNEEISNWDEDSENISEERSTRAIMDIETVKDDAWFIDDVMVDEQKRREDMIKESEENLLLINVDSNSDNVATESTIINTHPPIFHGTINNEMADSNDFILDYTNSNTTNMDIMNNSEYNLLSFDDEEDNKVPNSSDDVIIQPQENMHSFDFDKFEDFLENNRVTGVPASDDNKFEIVQPKIEATEDPNKLQSVSPYIINLNDNESSPTIDTFNQPKSYYREDFSQATTPQTYSQIESITPSSTLDVNVRDSENKGSVNDPNSTRATANVREYFININVETPSDGRQILRLSYDDNPQDVTTEFCRKWNMFQFEDALTGLVQKELKRKLRKRKGKCKINS